MASMERRARKMLEAARAREARHGGRSLRVRDHLRRAEVAFGVGGIAGRGYGDELYLDELEDEGSYLDDMEQTRAFPPNRFLSGFLALRISDLLNRREEGVATWDEVDRLAGWQDRLLARRAEAEGWAPGAGGEARGGGEQERLLEKVFRADCDIGGVERWAAMDALAPGVVGGLPGIMQAEILRQCMRAVRGRRSQPRVDLEANRHPCIVHSLWAQLLATAPPAREETGAAELTSMLAEMGGCCAGARDWAISSLAGRGAPLGELLSKAPPADEDGVLSAEERALVWSLLERAGEGDVRRAARAWKNGGAAQIECKGRAEKVLRWRGLRGAWAAAVVRAGLREPARSQAARTAEGVK